MSATVLLPVAVACAALAGFFGWQAHLSHVRVAALRKRVRGVQKGAAREGEGSDALLAHMMELSNLLEHHQTRPWCPKKLAHSAWFTEHVRVSGAAGRISDAAFCEMRFRLAVVLGAAGLIVGLCFSEELGVLLVGVGVVMGWRLPAASLKRRQEERTRRMEAHLPEMLDVMALGMSSGLSFDAAVKLYGAHFADEASEDLRRAQLSWESGLESREDALRRFATSYDSPVLGRVTETWIRSLRFGTSMVDGLLAEGAQARAAYKAKREECIAKVPVKMMVPTGTLILPAMLILVLGPVLLELMNGGF